MSFLHRKLSDDLINDNRICPNDCAESSESGVCPERCLDVCPKICKYASEYLSPPVIYHDHEKSKRILIIAASVIASAFLLFCLFVLYFRSRRRSRTRSRSSRLVVRMNGETRENDFLDEDHGPIIDHPIWHIRTIGLQPSVISSIRVCRYKKGGGLVEGTDCSVCLSEFQEDETLRLLPKCNHAFHLPCIDAWLRSHTNCPLCRAPIVANGASSSSSGSNNAQNPDETRVGIPEENAETDGETERDEQEREGQICQDNVVGNNAELVADEIQRVRRSVSLDSLSAIRINRAVTDMVKEKETNSRVHGNGKPQKLVASGSSAAGRSSFLKRSVSCGGKFLLPRYS